MKRAAYLAVAVLLATRATARYERRAQRVDRRLERDDETDAGRLRRWRERFWSRRCVLGVIVGE